MVRSTENISPGILCELSINCNCKIDDNDDDCDNYDDHYR